MALHLLLLLDSSFGLQDGVFELRPPVNVAAWEETQSSRLNAASLSTYTRSQFLHNDTLVSERGVTTLTPHSNCHI